MAISTFADSLRMMTLGVTGSAIMPRIETSIDEGDSAHILGFYISDAELATDALPPCGGLQIQPQGLSLCGL